MFLIFCFSTGLCCMKDFNVFIYSLFFFFFQAEDGIRDYKVTGVQTCALPIWLPRRVPGSIVAVVLGTALVSLFQFPVETIGTRFGGIPQGLPGLHPPPLSWADRKSVV